ncbi:MAG: SHOCT domain-containing protein [Thermoplasmata archaeon]
MYGTGSSGPTRASGRRTRVWVLLGIGAGILAAVLILFPLVVFGTLGPTFGGPHPSAGYWGGFFLLFLLVGVAFFVVRITLWGRWAHAGYSPRHARRRDPALMAARERYARGEITREQFDQIVTDLGYRGRGPGGPLSGA